MYKLELIIFKGTDHQFTGGANLISAVLVLALMILPTVINISESALRAVPLHFRSASVSRYVFVVSQYAASRTYSGGTSIPSSLHVR